MTVYIRELLVSMLQLRWVLDDNSDFFSLLFVNKSICSDPSLELSQGDGLTRGQSIHFYF